MRRIGILPMTSVDDGQDTRATSQSGAAARRAQWFAEKDLIPTSPCLPTFVAGWIATSPSRWPDSSIAPGRRDPPCRRSKSLRRLPAAPPPRLGEIERLRRGSEQTAPRFCTEVGRASCPCSMNIIGRMPMPRSPAKRRGCTERRRRSRVLKLRRGNTRSFSRSPAPATLSVPT